MLDRDLLRPSSLKAAWVSIDACRYFVISQVTFANARTILLL